MTNIPNGFIPYDEDDDSVILRASLKSASDIGGGSLVGSGTGDVTYSDNGILLNVNASLRLDTVLTAAQKTQLSKGFTFTVWIEKEYMDSVPVGNYESIFFFWDTGNTNQVNTRKLTGTAETGVKHGGTGNPAQSARLYETGKDDFVRIDFSGNSRQTILYVDYFPVAQADGVVLPSDIMTNVHLGGQNGKSPQGVRMKDLQISTKPVMLPVRNHHMMMIGHSFADDGDYPSGARAYIQGDKLNGDSTGEARSLTRIHREIGKLGFGIPQTKIRNYGVGGDSVSDLAAQITSALADSNIFDIVMIQIGANEIIAGTGDFNTDYPTWQSDIETVITSLISNGATKIFLANVVSTANDVVHGAQAYLDRVDDANAIIDAVVAGNSQVYKVDLFNAFNGHNVDSSDFATDDIHPSDQGHNKIGVQFAREIISNL